MKVSTNPIPFANSIVLFLEPRGVLIRVIKPITPYLLNKNNLTASILKRVYNDKIKIKNKTHSHIKTS